MENVDYVIFGAMRSGSNLLQEKLNYFTDIICLGELFNPAFVGVDRPHINKLFFAGYGRNNKESLKKRDEFPLQLLSDVAALAHDRNKIVGFRFFDNHNEKIKEALLRDKSVKKIILYRDLVDSFVSLELARLTGQWVKKGVDKLQSPKVDFKVKKFERYVKKSQDYFSTIKSFLDADGQSYILVDYNQVLSDLEVTKVAGFLGSQSRFNKKETKLKKQNSSDLSDKISNYSEIRDYLDMFNETVFRK